MIEALAGILKSKKFVAGIAGMVAGLAARVGLELEVAEVMAIMAPLVAAILGQGVADHGKEAVKAEAP